MSALTASSLGTFPLIDRADVSIATPLAQSPASAVKSGHGLRVLAIIIQFFKRKQSLQVWLLWKESH